MRVCIVGFDSLDYYLVEKYDLKCLKQKDYGKVEINTGVLATPTIWTSFVTGLLPKEHGIIGWKMKNPFLDKMQIWSIKIGLNRIIDRSQILTQLGRRWAEGNVPIIRGRIPTIFDYAQRPVDIDVPCYSEDVYEESRREIYYGVGKPITAKLIAEKSWRAFWEKKERVLDALSKNWDLFMVHFFLPDIIQHILWYRKNEIERLYREMDNVACNIKKRVGKNTFTLFVSDHGQKKGLHTPYGFYSCNRRLKLHEPKVTDFADIIKRELGHPLNASPPK